jgi:hypothetical protein
MVEDMGLKIIASRTTSLHYPPPPTKYHENLPSDSKVINGVHTDTQTHRHKDRQTETGKSISLLSFFGK